MSLLQGSIESGKLADMAIISDDFLTCPVERIRDIKAIMTLVGGKIVYSPEILRQGNYYIIPVAIQK